MNLEDDVLSFIPQRDPFVMIGKMLHSDEWMTRTSFSISADNIFVENGVFGEPGLLENIAQTAASRAGYAAREENKPVVLGYIGAVRNFEVFVLPKVGDELITEITIEHKIFDATAVNGKVWCKDTLLAQCEMKIFSKNN
jgi:predicted hotdog family 3-hydroxylacyl-ACP dehydratase